LQDWALEMTVIELFEEFRNRFPDLSDRVDIEHEKSWGEVDPENSFCWFESLANVINSDMHAEVPPASYNDVFEFFRSSYLMGSDKVKECIDVSVTENMFWKVSPEKAKIFWDIFPALLQDLYIKFHGRAPI